MHGPTAMYPAATCAMVCADVPGRSAAGCARASVSFERMTPDPLCHGDLFDKADRVRGCGV